VSDLRRRLRAALGAVAIALAVPAAAAAADPSQPAAEVIPLNVIVVHTSDAAGGVDPRARELDAQLKKQLRYESMRVVHEERVELRIDEVGTIALPDGRSVRLRPLHRDATGVLIAVDVEGAVKFDARAANHHKLVIGAGAYRDGHLAVSLEPDYAD